jgi:hypothetical protein
MHYEGAEFGLLLFLLVFLIGFTIKYINRKP